jgi:cation diffusion facilitator CzcD-associated flavoprotein CzcO
VSLAKERTKLTETLSEPVRSVQELEHFDVLIIGAGLSGIGAAHHLNEQCPQKNFVVLESMPNFGGTWQTHRYPGARSDSDLYTYGYRFKPWTGAPIAAKDEILKYLSDVIADEDMDRHIRYEHQVTSASWSSGAQRWTLNVTRSDTDEVLQISATFLWMCQGYYRHSVGHTPSWAGMDQFEGPIVHPQSWPDDFEYADKNVVVIGSGATAATLIPAMANDCRHVTMLQRSPTFFYIRTNVNEVADMLRELDIPDAWIHEIVRQKILLDSGIITKLTIEFPELAREELLRPIREILGGDYDVETHFNPRYKPWQQRIAVVPNGDLFEAIRDGKVSVVTDEIDSFTRTGIKLKSGATLDADVIITATGFDMNVLGDIAFSIDGRVLDLSQTITYRGLMFTGVPNLLQVFGYYRSSYTLRVDLIGDFLCRLFKYMESRGVDVVTPQLRSEETEMTLAPWVEPEHFNPGYMNRSVHLLPKQGSRDPWRNELSYYVEKETLPAADFEDGSLRFT